MKFATIDDRFDAKWDLDPGTGCHIWRKPNEATGYGIFWLNGKNIGSHVYAWERVNGPVPTGHHLDHFKCERHACCNPHHLRPATPRENTYRSDSICSINLAKTHCPKGHPYSPKNTYIVKRNGFRQCRTCKADEAYQRYRDKHPNAPHRTRRSKKEQRADGLG